MPVRVALFATCLVDQLFPAVGLSTAELLERLGYSVFFPPQQTCCGQPAFNSGHRAEALLAAQAYHRAMSAADYIVVPSGSCTAMITRHYTELGQEREVSSRTFELSQFLLQVAGVDDLGARFPHRVTYHDACHALRELRLQAEPRRLLSRVSGLDLVETPVATECCGFGGTFCVKFPDVSVAMARTKLRAMVETGAEYVVSADSSCLMQLSGVIRRDGLPLKTIHLAEVLNSR